MRLLGLPRPSRNGRSAQLSVHAPARVTNTGQLEQGDRLEMAASPSAGRLTAQAANGSSANGASTRRRQGWASDAWGYYDAVGELHFAAQFEGSAFSRIHLRVGVRLPDNQIGPLRDDEGDLTQIEGGPQIDQALAEKAEAAVETLADPITGQAGLMAGAGTNLFVAGECYLVGRDVEDDGGQILQRTWEVCSTEEIRPIPDARAGGPQWRREFGDGRQAEDLPPSTFVYRIHRRHPRLSALADSSVRPLLDVLEEIVLLTRQVRAETTSRLAQAGILFIPDEMDWPEDPEAEEGSEERDPFAHALMRAMTAAIVDKGSPAAVVPLVVRAAAEHIDKVKHLSFVGELDPKAINKRDEAIQRLAQGLDLPPEIVLGHQQTTFANAQQVSEDVYQLHIGPAVGLFCGALTVGYLWPELMGGRQGVPPDDVAMLVIVPDPSHLITQPDRSKNAVEAHDRLAISDAALRREMGFSDGDAPDAEEVLERLRWAMLRASRETIRANEGSATSIIPPELQSDAPITGPANEGGAGGGGAPAGG